MRNIIKNKKLFLLFLFLWLFFIAFGTQAKELEQSYPTFLGKSISGSSTLIELIEYVYYFALAISGIAVFIMLVFGGVKWLTSLGNPAKLNDAKDQIVSSLLGLVLILSAVLILNTINPDLVFVKNPITDFTGGLDNIEGVFLSIGKGVVLYEDADYKKGYFPLEAGKPIADFSDCDTYEFKNSQTCINDNISSMQMATEYAILCLYKDYKACVYTNSDISNFQDICVNWKWEIFRRVCVRDLNDDISSARIGFNPDESAKIGNNTTDCDGVLLFNWRNREINLGFASQKISKFHEYTGNTCDPIQDVSGVVNSLVISGRCKITLYDNSSCTGATISFSNNYNSDSTMTCEGKKCCDNLSAPINCTCEDDYNCVQDLKNYSFPGDNNWGDKADGIKIEALQ